MCGKRQLMIYARLVRARVRGAVATIQVSRDMKFGVVAYRPMTCTYREYGLHDGMRTAESGGGNVFGV